MSAFYASHPPNARSMGQYRAYLNLQNCLDTSTPDANQTLAAERSPYRELNEPVTGRTRKRPGEGDGRKPDMSLRRDSRKDASSRLLQNHQPNPPDAQQIRLPESRRPGSSHAPNTSSTRNRSGGRQIRPQNTLGENPHAANGSRYGAHGTMGADGIKRLPKPNQLELSMSRGFETTTSRHQNQEEAFTLHDERSAKRPKLDHHKVQKSSTCESPIDLTEDSQEYVAVQHSPNQHFADLAEPVLAESPRVQIPVQQPSEFINRRPDVYIRIPTQKKKRKEMGSAESSQASTRASSSHSQNQVLAGNLSRRGSSSVVIQGDDPPAISWLDKVGLVRFPRPRSTVSELQALERLQSPRDEGGTRRTKPDHRNGNDLEVAERNLQHEPLLQPSGKQIVQNETSGLKSSHFNQPMTASGMEPNLRDVFKRDTADRSHQSKMRAPQKMMASSASHSNRDPHRDSLGSADELNGETTVGSRAIRRPSPRVVVSGPASTQLKHSLTEPKTTPPDRQNQRTKDGTAKHQRASSRTFSAEEPIRIPIQMIWCRSCCLEGDGIELVWDVEDPGFRVECDGKPQRMAQRPQIVTIDKYDVSRWSRGQESESLNVHIQGPATDNSNGHILISFVDEDGRNDCFNGLYSLTHDGLKEGLEPPGRMTMLLNNLRWTIQDDHDRAKRKASPRDAQSMEMRLFEQRKLARHIGANTIDDDIKHEIQPPEGRRSRRSQMQSGDAIRNVASQSRSIFDMPDNLDTGRKLRQSKPARPKSPTPPPPIRWTRQNGIPKWSHSVVYPPEGAVRRVTVDCQDLERLDEGEFLNDNIIGFALRQIEERMASEHKSSVHFFNTFFYEALTTKNGKKGFNYDAVKRWTKNKDLFNTPYVVVPINLDLHWFVAIICNLDNLPRKVRDADDESLEMLDNPSANTEMSYKIPVTDGSIQHAEMKTNDTQESMENLSLDDHEVSSTTVAVDSDKVSATGNSGEPPSSSTTNSPLAKKSKKKSVPPMRKFDSHAPTIITLDSFGIPRSAEIRNIKEYVRAEAESKRGMAVDFKDLQGLTAKGIPEQPNFCDCGVYLVGYIEEFAKDPRTFVTKLLQRKMDAKSDFAGFDPSAKRAEIRDELLKLHDQQNVERRAKKAAKQSSSAVDGNVRPAEEVAVPAVAEEQGPRPVEQVVQAQESSSHPTNFHEFMQQLDGSVEMENTSETLQGVETEEMVMEVPRALPAPAPVPQSPEVQRPAEIPDSQDV